MKGSGLLNALLVAAALAVCAGTASAATYYVDCDSAAATDSHTKEEAQNEATPWKTFWWSGRQAEPGDTVLVKDGICWDTQDPSDTNQLVYLNQKGEEAGRKWTYFKAYPGHHPHIRFKLAREGTPSSGKVLAKNGIGINGSYIWLEGLEISPEDYQPDDYWGGWNIWITGGHHIVVRNCNLHDSPLAGVGSSWTDYVTIENNTIWNNAKWSCGNSSGIHIYQPYDSGVEFGATTVNGIDYRIVIANNRIYGNEAKVNTCFQDYPTDGNGIILDDFGSTQVGEDAPPWMKAHEKVLYPHRTLIMNNVIYNNGGRGILAFISSHADILHNTLYNNMQSQPLRDKGFALAEIACGGTDMRVFNNIASAQYTASLYLKNDLPFPGQSLPEKISYGNNLTYGGGIETDSGASDAGGNIVQDPLLAAPGLNADSDFHLLGGSPAINKGSAANSVPKDFEGTSRPLGGLPDIGAYETQSDSAKTVNPANGHSYQRFGTPRTWKDAQAACTALGGYPAAITGATENSWIVANIAGGTAVWLGGTDQTTEGTWKWVTGEAWNWTNWAAGEPNDGCGGQDYLQLYPDGTWDDHGGPGCFKDVALPYICEWDSEYIGTAVVPDLNADGVPDQAVLVLRSGSYRLRTVSGATGGQLREMLIGTAASGITAVSLASSGSQLSVVIARPLGSIIQVRDSTTLALVRTINLLK